MRKKKHIKKNEPERWEWFEQCKKSSEEAIKKGYIWAPCHLLEVAEYGHDENGNFFARYWRK